jgi:hypothetical protein
VRWFSYHGFASAIAHYRSLPHFSSRIMPSRPASQTAPTPSALRVAILSAPRQRWHTRDHPESALTVNGVEAWAYAFAGEYIGYDLVTKRDLQDFDLVIANSNTTYIPRLVELAAVRPAHTRWVTLIEGGASEYLKPMPSIQAVFEVSDVVNCINEPSLELFRALGRGKPAKVEYIGIPYPVEGVRRHAIPPEQRFDGVRKELMICPVLLNRCNDWLLAQAIAEQASGAHDIHYYGFQAPLARKFPNWRDILRALASEGSVHRSVYLKRAAKLYNDSRLTIRASTSLEIFFEKNAHGFLWLNLEDRYTWARYVLDAATLGIPILTTRATGHSTTLFPQTTFDNEFSIAEAAETALRLLDDRDFYCDVSHGALAGMAAFTPEAMAAKLLQQLSW